MTSIAGRTHHDLRPSSGGETLRIDSLVLGTRRVSRERVFQFRDGLIGFPDCHRFVLFPTLREDLFWLQAVDDPPLIFLLVDPLTVVDELTVDLAGTGLEELTETNPDRLTVLAIVTLPRTPDALATVNLQGLVVVDVESRVGRQLVLPDSPYGVRWAFELSGLRRAS